MITAASRVDKQFSYSGKFTHDTLLTETRVRVTAYITACIRIKHYDWAYHRETFFRVIKEKMCVDIAGSFDDGGKFANSYFRAII